jgi:hypothetical protein
VSEKTGPGSLKLVIAVSERRDLPSAFEALLREQALADSMRALGEGLLVYTEAAVDELRERLAPLLQDGESLLVIEFERWSSHGAGVDGAWLRRRGH